MDKRPKYKRRETTNLSYKLKAHSSAYKPMTPSTRDYQKSNYDNQTDNKENNRNIDMSIGLGEEKKSRPKTKDQNEEKPSSPKEDVTSSQPLQSEVFDSSSDNAMSEMKKVADMGPDETTKIFLDVDGNQQLDPLTTNINDSIKKADSDPTTSSPMAEPTLQERDPGSIKSQQDNVCPKQDVKSEVSEVQSGSADRDYLDESVTIYDSEKVLQSSSPNNDIYNPFIIGIKFWQAHNIAWINAYNEFIKVWVGNIRLTDPKNI